ncbi:MAG: isochorismatase family protein [Thermoplasmataceae archaeon]
MAETGADFSIVQDITLENTAILGINLKLDCFSGVFSKLEFINAVTYLRNLADRNNISSFNVSTVAEDNGFRAYMQMKMERRLQRSAPKSALDRGFDAQFEKMFSDADDSILSKSEDIFSSSVLIDILHENRIRYALIIGFHTETAVLRSALSALDHGIMPVVVSDAVSSYSERIYYEALDIISQSVEIIDSRDLMKRWPDQ